MWFVNQKAGFFLRAPGEDEPVETWTSKGLAEVGLEGSDTANPFSEFTNSHLR